MLLLKKKWNCPLVPRSSVGVTWGRWLLVNNEPMVWVRAPGVTVLPNRLVSPPPKPFGVLEGKAESWMFPPSLLTGSRDWSSDCDIVSLLSNAAAWFPPELVTELLREPQKYWLYRRPDIWERARWEVSDFQVDFLLPAATFTRACVLTRASPPFTLLRSVKPQLQP